MSDTLKPAHDAIVFLGFGGPESPDDVRPFIDRVLGGRRIPPDRYEQVVGNYALIGGTSPYNERTRQLADALGAALAQSGVRTPVAIAYLNAAPFVDDVFARLAEDGVKRILAIVLAPHEGAAGRDKYVHLADEACKHAGLSIEYVDPFFDHPLFIAAHAQQIRDAQVRLAAGGDSALIFTAHSIPTATPGADRYVEELNRTAQLIAAELNAPQWTLAYQSRSGAPSDPWLEPDVRDVLRGFPANGSRTAIVDPIGFLCDHVEVLYDIDLDAQAVAAQAGVRFERAATMNDHPLFVRMLAELTVSKMR